MIHFTLAFIGIFIWLFSLPLIMLFAFLCIPLGMLSFVLTVVISLCVQWHHKEDIIVHSRLRNFIKNINLQKWFTSFKYTNNTKKADLLICHPHGILCCGMIVHHFNSINTVFAVAPILFYVPIFGWVARSLGLIPASKRMIKKALRQNCTVILYVGGIQELLAHNEKKYI